MMVIHGATHSFRDITETKIRIQSLKQFAIYAQYLAQFRNRHDKNYLCGCDMLPEELGGSDAQKILNLEMHFIMADHMPLSECSYCSVFLPPSVL